MNRLAPTQRVSPRERLIFAGLTREAVGGGAVLFGKTPDGATQQPTGFTRPLIVTNASVEVLPADFSRKFLFLQNNDAVGVVFVSVGGAGAALNQGFRLGAGGGGILLDVNVPTDRIFMIGSIANNPNVTAITG